MRKILTNLLLFTGLALVCGCGKSYEDSGLWSQVNAIDRRVTDIETTISRLNGDLTTIRQVVESGEKGLSVTDVTKTSEGWRVTYNNGSVFTLPTNMNDGATPYISGGTWWIDGRNTGLPATGPDGQTPYIGTNGNWWIGTTDTGVPATGTATGEDSLTGVPILGVDIYTDGRYYWTQTLNGTKTWLLDSRGNMMPVSGNDAQRPIIRVSMDGYWTVSYDGGITYEYILDGGGRRVKLSSDGCPCTTYFRAVQIVHPYLVIVLIDGTVIKIRIDGGGIIPADPDDPTPDPGPDPDPLPNPTPSPGDIEDEITVRLDMTGIQDPVTGEWLKLYGTGLDNQNAWLDLDGKPKGILVVNNEDSEQQTTSVKLDIVFTVDNSSSMDNEANTIARDIAAWAQKLQASGLDVSFACVGYSVSGVVNGGIDFCDATSLSNWLNSNGSGTNHTVGFADKQLQSAAGTYYRPGDECGAIAIRFADENMTFRTGANRVYINFTDEGNQPNGNAQYSVEWFRDQNNWSPAQGTIHTVYSGSTESWSTLYNEDPTLISTYTGGTIFRTNGSFSGVNLDNLTVTEAMKHSYIIYFRVPESYFDGQMHEVRITVITPDRHVRAQRTFYMTFSK